MVALPFLRLIRGPPPGWWTDGRVCSLGLHRSSHVFLFMVTTPSWHSACNHSGCTHSQQHTMRMACWWLHRMYPMEAFIQGNNKVWCRGTVLVLCNDCARCRPPAEPLATTCLSNLDM
jgi:hypothetical protein